MNAFGFWQGQDISNATHQYFDDIMQAYSHISAVGGGKIEVWNGETGWPSDGIYVPYSTERELTIE